MDFNLARVIEVFEERFGRRASAVLIILVGLAIASWALNIIITDLVIPSYNVATKLSELGATSEVEALVLSITRKQVVSAVISITFITIISAIYFTMLKWRVYASVSREIAKNPDKFVGACSERIDELLSQKIADARDKAILDWETKTGVRQSKGN